MQMRYWLTMLRFPKLLTLAGVMQDWQVCIKFYFLFAALESGLLEGLRAPASREELLSRLAARRPEFLDALLELGLSLGQLAQKNGVYRLRGGLCQALLGPQGDMLAAVIQANATYYHSIYRQATARLRGAPDGDYLEEIAGTVARFSKFTEPFLRRFLKDHLPARGPARILDVGCGSGVFLHSAHAANPACAGLGLEMDSQVAEQARANLERWGMARDFAVAVGDIRQPPPEVRGPYEVITLFNLVYYFQDEERLAIFRSLRSLLAPGGVMLLASNLHSQGKDFGAANLNLATCSIKGCTPLPRAQDLCDQLRQAGFGKTPLTRIMPASTYYGIAAG
ncbi:MAG: class I SAM-dependent methyltransferase [Pseudomonadota bacterium]